MSLVTVHQNHKMLLISQLRSFIVLLVFHYCRNSEIGSLSKMELYHKCSPAAASKYNLHLYSFLPLLRQRIQLEFIFQTESHCPEVNLRNVTDSFFFFAIFFLFELTPFVLSVCFKQRNNFYKSILTRLRYMHLLRKAHYEVRRKGSSSPLKNISLNCKF